MEGTNRRKGLPEGFDGFITAEGEMVSMEDVDGMCGVLMRQSESAEHIKQTLMVFARECAKNGYLAAACSISRERFP